MDQATPADQGLLRHQRERGEDPNLDRVSVYVLVAIIRKRLGLEASLYQILQIFSVTLFEKTPISIAVFDISSQFDQVDDGNQLQLFDL